MTARHILSLHSVLRQAPTRHISCTKRSLSTTISLGKEHNEPDWSGRKSEEHLANRKDELDVQSGASQSGKRERAADNPGSSGATSERDSGRNNERAKQDTKAPGPVIGMNDERGGDIRGHLEVVIEEGREAQPMGG